MITKKYELKLLTKDFVDVSINSFTEIDGIEYLLKTEGKAYCNSEMGRILVTAELPEDYVKTIFTLWGDSATVEDPPYGGPTEE